MTQIVSREEALLTAAKKLDISPTKYKQAIDRFNSMKTHLEQGNYPGTYRAPDVYLQGSFKLGTENSGVPINIIRSLFFIFTKLFFNFPYYHISF